jgi:hypothetical protein
MRKVESYVFRRSVCVCILIAGCASLSLAAQDYEGEYYEVEQAKTFIGGTLSYQYASSDNSDDSNASDVFEISPLIGWRFNRTDIGLSFLYRHGTASSSFDVMTSIGFGVFGSYNFVTVDKSSIIGRASVQYINSKYNFTGTSYSTEQTINTIGISITPVFEYKFLEHFTLYTSIGSISFSHSWDESDSYSSDSFGLSLSTGIALGFYVFF